jgi:hypothetical protein
VSPVLTRDQIKIVDDRRIEAVEVPEWGGVVYVRGLSGTDRDSFEMAMIEQRSAKGGRRTQEVNLRNLRAKLVVRTAVDSDDTETAKPLFEMADVEWLGRKSAQALQRVYAVAQRLSGLSNEEVEELTVDLGEGQSGDSGSDSPLPLAIAPSPSASATSAATSSRSGLRTTGSSPLEEGGSTS